MINIGDYVLPSNRCLKDDRFLLPHRVYGVTRGFNSYFLLKMEKRTYSTFLLRQDIFDDWIQNCPHYVLDPNITDYLDQEFIWMHKSYINKVIEAIYPDGNSYFEAVETELGAKFVSIHYNKTFEVSEISEDQSKVWVDLIT